MKKTFRSIALALLVPVCIFAQAPSALFKKYTETLPLEHVYVQFDKQAYLAGESIWFKGYVVLGYSLNPRSTDLYIEVLNEKDSLVLSKRLPIVQGTVRGNLDLPANLAQGLYLVRGYSRWQMNTDQSFVFKKAIPVFNPTNNNPATAVKANPAYAFEMFPEGGQMVTAVPTNIAFKAYDDKMQEVKIKAHLEDLRGNNLGNFADGSTGIGTFSFTPVAGDKYFAFVEFPGLPAKRFDLPVAIDKGATLTVSDHESGGKIFSAILSPTQAQGTDEVLVLATMDNYVITEAKVKLKDNEAIGVISTENLPNGILQVMIFDNQNNLLAQRYTYIANHKLSQGIEMKTNTLALTPKAKNDFTFTFPDSIDGSFSVSVTDADRELIRNNRQDIYTNLLLQSGSVNFIDDPGINNPEAVDLVMMTSNWYVNNKPVAAKMKLPGFDGGNYIMLKGKVFEKNTSKVIGDASMNVVLMDKQGSQRSYTVKTDKEGNFMLDHLVYEDSATIYYAVEKTKNQEPPIAELVVEKETDKRGPFIRQISLAQYAKAYQGVFNDPELTKTAAALYGKTMPAQEVAKTANKTPADKSSKSSIKKDKYGSGVFGSSRAKTFDLVKDPPVKGLNIFEYLTGRVAGLTIEKTGPGRYLLYNSRTTQMSSVMNGAVALFPTNTPSGSPGAGFNSAGRDVARVYLDEVETTSEAVAAMSSDQIAMIKYFEPGAIQLPGAGNGGILAFWTKEHDDLSINDLNGMSSLKYFGYPVNKTFYSPDYATENRSVSDNRVTLYWNPDIQMTGNKEFNIQFYNSDAAKKLHIVVEGITTDGKVVHFEKFIPGL